jgi:hypothetical protein
MGHRPLEVLTAVRRKAVPLDEVGGHLFTVYVTGYDAFEPLSEREASADPNEKRTFLSFSYDATACTHR